MPPPRTKQAITFATVAALFVWGAAGLADWRQGVRDVEIKAELITGGSIARGKQAFARYGCGSCHTAAGVAQATGTVGPPLTGITGRAIIGGRLENKPSNLMLWIRDPQHVSPGTAMPRLGVTPADSRDLAAFLYTQT
ncbi:MAG TPA: c-type cytochrome [Allosphingosinicella sp.]|nr:c-type cytochrome [Allosphingosinicella sp.]